MDNLDDIKENLKKLQKELEIVTEKLNNSAIDLYQINLSLEEVQEDGGWESSNC